MLNFELNKTYVHSARNKGVLGIENVYKYVGPNRWEQYHKYLDGKLAPTGRAFENFDILVFISNGARFINEPKALRKLV